jgi:hypothetical protein
MKLARLRAGEFDREVGVDVFITGSLVLGLLVVPGMINYFANRYYTSGSVLASTGELVAASMTLTFVIVVLDILGVLLVSLAWEDLKEEIADFVQLGLVGYGQDRPVALAGVLSAYSVALMSALALLGVFRVPSRFVR